MKQKITPHLKALLHIPAISTQFVDGFSAGTVNTYSDPLNEEAHEITKGLVHKYHNRALIKISYQCAAHCRFCTRIRQIGDPAGTLTETDIDNIITYLQAHPEIDDVILSGGDPLYTPHITTAVLLRLQKLDSVKVLRIGSRLAVHSPRSFATKPLQNLLQLINEIGENKPFYLLLHINSVHELTPEVRAVIKDLRKLNITLLSQTVFLKGVNDSYEAMYDLYKEMYYIGITPYYLYHCDHVAGLEHFAVDIDRENAIMQKLVSTLSGIGCPRFVIDVEDGYGKLPVSLGFTDMEGNIIQDYTLPARF